VTVTGLQLRIASAAMVIWTTSDMSEVAATLFTVMPAPKEAVGVLSFAGPSKSRSATLCVTVLRGDASIQRCLWELAQRFGCVFRFRAASRIV